MKKNLPSMCTKLCLTVAAALPDPLLMKHPAAHATLPATIIMTFTKQVTISQINSESRR
jgi:hypothetical protein